MKCNCDALLGMSVCSAVFLSASFNRNIKIVIKSDVYELPLPPSVKPGLVNCCDVVHQMNFVLPRLLEIYTRFCTCKLMHKFR